MQCLLWQRVSRINQSFQDRQDFGRGHSTRCAYVPVIHLVPSIVVKAMNREDNATQKIEKKRKRSDVDKEGKKTEKLRKAEVDN